jgi:hypothetical protein
MALPLTEQNGHFPAKTRRTISYDSPGLLLARESSQRGLMATLGCRRYISQKAGRCAQGLSHLGSIEVAFLNIHPNAKDRLRVDD